jgi:hypothetical protein
VFGHGNRPQTVGVRRRPHERDRQTRRSARLRPARNTPPTTSSCHNASGTGLHQVVRRLPRHPELGRRDATLAAGSEDPSDDHAPTEPPSSSLASAARPGGAAGPPRRSCARHARWRWRRSMSHSAPRSRPGQLLCTGSRFRSCNRSAHGASAPRISEIASSSAAATASRVASRSAAVAVMGVVRRRLSERQHEFRRVVGEELRVRSMPSISPSQPCVSRVGAGK